MPHLRFVIRQSDIPTLIGSSGSVVKKLEKETNTKIGIDRETGTSGKDWNSRLRSVEVKGNKEDLVKALIEITTTITPPNDEPFLQIQLLLEDEQFTPTRFIKRPKDGRMNKKVESLNEKVSARCKVVPVGQIGGTGIEVLSSSPDAFEEALTKVVDLLLVEGSQGKDATDRESIMKLSKKTIEEQLEEITSKATIAFLIPAEKTSVLIGPKGVTVKKMQKDHDVKLQVESQNSSYTNIGRTVLIHGSIKNIGECIAAITEKIFKGEGDDARVAILLPPRVASFIIGKGGEAIKRVEKQSECVLDIEGANVRTGAGGLEYCRITGNKETIIIGVQGVVARISMQLDILGLTAEAAYPPGLDFKWLPSEAKKSEGPWYFDKPGAFGSSKGAGWVTSGVRDGKAYSTEIRPSPGLASNGWSTTLTPMSAASPPVRSSTSLFFKGVSTRGGGWGASKPWRETITGRSRTPWSR